MAARVACTNLFSGSPFHNPPSYPVPRAGALNFMHRDGWSLHIIAADCKTVLLTFRCVRDEMTLLRIVAKLGGDVGKAKRDMNRWGRGSVWIDPSPVQCKALGISVRAEA